MSQRDVRLFISYKTDTVDPRKSTGLSQTAHMIRRILENHRFDVWMDVMRLKAGGNWADQIHEGLKNSDIVLFLISDKSKTSSGQQKEIETARREKKAIIPIYIRGKFNAVEVMEQTYKLIEYQMVDFRIGDDNQVNKLLEEIKSTAIKLKLEVPDLNTKRKSKDEITPPQAKYATYQIDDYQCNIHLSLGNLMEMKDIDVFVNSENAYLQMARIFESSTISALLRYEGSYIKKRNQQLAEDTIQEELDRLIAQSRGTDDEITLPAPFGTVLVTSAGHPASNLRKANKPRFIFHTVAVQVRGTGTDKKMDPAKDGEIKNCTINTLEMINTVNTQKGVVSPPGTGKVISDGHIISERERQIEVSQKDENDKDAYKPITSIILPLFASGHAGIQEGEVASAVIQPICEGIREFLRNNHDKTTLTDIHICVYGYKLLPIMEKVIDELDYFRLAIPPKKPIQPLI